MSVENISTSRPAFWEQYKKPLTLLLTFIIGAILYFSPRPDGITAEAWHLFAIFFATILGIILKPFPMGAIALFGLLACILTNTLTFDQAFSGFNNGAVWLIALAFFIARGFIKTGLGNRVAYLFMSLLGKSTLGLSYGILLTDLMLAPTIPSVTARSGGVIFPILQSLTKAFGSEPLSGKNPRLGAFLILACFQGSVITSAMFLTSMAGNPLAAKLAADVGVEITWLGWATAAIVPGLISLFLIPYIIYKLHPPEVKKTPHASAFAKEKLKEMGKMKSQEKVMLITFGLLLTLWIFGSFFAIKATVAALLGLALLVLTNVLSWKEVIEEKGAWDTLFWFAALVTMATFLNKFGLISWFSSSITGHVAGFSWQVGFIILAILYYYSHYFFASNLAHIGAMYAPFLIVSTALGTPPLLAALCLGFISNLFGGISHYGCGPAPILFGAGYVSIGTWWKMGGLISIINILVWGILGGVWWKILGLW